MRSPTDDGVDRPDLDAPQGVKATGTNRPKQTHQTPQQGLEKQHKQKQTNNHVTVARVHYTVSDTTHTTRHTKCLVCLSVAYSSRETPGPIPNPEAKPANADGTATGRLWESKKPPTPNNNKQLNTNQRETVETPPVPTVSLCGFPPAHRTRPGGRLHQPPPVQTPRPARRHTQLASHPPITPAHHHAAQVAFHLWTNRKTSRQREQNSGYAHLTLVDPALFPFPQL